MLPEISKHLGLHKLTQDDGTVHLVVTVTTGTVHLVVTVTTPAVSSTAMRYTYHWTLCHHDVFYHGDQIEDCKDLAEITCEQCKIECKEMIVRKALHV